MLRPRKLAIVRSSSVLLSSSDYNIQEIGLATALLDFKISSDIYLAGNVSKAVVVPLCEQGDSKVRLIYLPFKKLPGKQSIFCGLRRSLEAEKYDLIQVHEDSQITSCIIAVYGAWKSIPVVLCQGMYKNYDGYIPKLFQYIYDRTILPILRKNVAYCIAKTRKAELYLKDKLFQEITADKAGKRARWMRP